MGNTGSRTGATSAPCAVGDAGRNIPPPRPQSFVAQSELEADAYMEAFMNGFEFVLLAIRGRLAEADLPREERARLERFLADYSRIAQAYRARRTAPAGALVFHGRVEADVALVTTN